MHAGRRLFGDAAPLLRHVVPALRIFRMHLLQQCLDDGLFLRLRLAVDEALVAVFVLKTLMDQQGHVAAIVDYQLRPLATLMPQRLVRAPPILLQRLALPGKHRHTTCCNSSSRMVLRAEDVAARPAHSSAQLHQRLDQHRRLDSHVQRAGNAHALQRLARGALPPDGHQSRHLLLGDRDLFASPLRQANVRNFVVFRRRHGCCCHLASPQFLWISSNESGQILHSKNTSPRHPTHHRRTHCGYQPFSLPGSTKHSSTDTTVSPAIANSPAAKLCV